MNMVTINIILINVFSLIMISLAFAKDENIDVIKNQLMKKNIMQSLKIRRNLSKKTDEFLKQHDHKESKANNDKFSKTNDNKLKINQSRITDATNKTDKNIKRNGESKEVNKSDEDIIPNGTVIENQSDENKSGLPSTDTSGLPQSGNIIKSLRRDKNFPFLFPTSKYPISKLALLEQQIHSLYVPKLYNPTANSAAQLQNSGSPHRITNPKSPSSGQITEFSADKNEYLYSPLPTQTNFIRNRNPFTTQRKDNVNYHLRNQKWPISISADTNCFQIQNPLPIQHKDKVNYKFQSQIWPMSPFDQARHPSIPLIRY